MEESKSESVCALRITISNSTVVVVFMLCILS